MKDKEKPLSEKVFQYGITNFLLKEDIAEAIDKLKEKTDYNKLCNFTACVHTLINEIFGDLNKNTESVLALQEHKEKEE
jgi:hypothetical protein